MTRLLQLLIHRSARFRALMHKELLTTLKDRTSRMILVGPLVLYVILFGYVATFNLDYAPYALLDMSKTRQSAELIRAVDESAVFDRVMTLQNTAQIAPAIDSGKALVVLVIGQDYAEKLSEGQVAPVQVIIDGRNSTTAQLAAGYLSIIAGNVSGAGTVFESIRYLYNPNNLTQWFILPALIMMLSMLQIMVLSALSVAREREMGTFEQLLVTPFTTGELLASKAVDSDRHFSGDVDFPDFGVLVSGAADGQYSENLCRDGGLCTVHRWAGTCHFGLQQNHAAGTFDCVCDARSDGIAFGAFYSC